MALANKSFTDLITFTRGSIATYFDAQGVLQESAVDTPRFEYDPATGEAKGLKVEKTSTNVLLNSEDLTSWGPVRATVTADQSDAPDGTTTMDKIVENTDNNSHLLTQSFTKAASAIDYTFSMFVKAAERDKCRLLFQNTSTFAGYLSGMFDLAAGTVDDTQVAFSTGWTFRDHGIEDCGGGVYRIWMSVISDTTTTIRPAIELADAGGNRTYTGDGTSGLYGWGGQLETRDTVTSYIPTAGSPITRSAELAVISGTDFSNWFNPTQGTFVVEAVGDGGANSRALTVSDGTSNERLTIIEFGDTVRALVTDGGTSQASLVSSESFVSSFKAGLAYAAADFALCVNGGTVLTEASGTVPTVDRMHIGSTFSGAQINGYIKSITYYPTRLTNAELQALTT